MAYFTNIFSPETYVSFSKSDRTISGFRENEAGKVARVRPGDKLVCYMTKFSRWVGLLEITSGLFRDDTPIHFEDNDPFVVRLKVKPIVWLARDHTFPIHEDDMWENLTFTKGREKRSSHWTGTIRSSLKQMDEADGRFLEATLLTQSEVQHTFPIDDAEFEKQLGKRVRRPGGTVTVSVPDEEEQNHADEQSSQNEIRPSHQIQAILAGIGEKMGFQIWVPRNDRQQVMRGWSPDEDSLLEVLPLNYDDVTLKTIEQIDVLWLNKRAIVRAFEVEHTTAVYSGILRMADLLALQPNMDIKLHIVAPYDRKGKVFQEIRRPVFSLLDRGPLAEMCTFISYASVSELIESKHLSHLSDSVLEDFEEFVD